MNPLQQLLIERECQRLLLQSMLNTDFGVAAQTADLFIPDGVMYVGPTVLRGRDAIRAALVQRQTMTNRVSRHVATNITIAVRDEHHASVSCYITVYRHDGDPGQLPAPLNGPASIGQHDVEFILTDDGWRFAEAKWSISQIPVGLRGRPHPAACGRHPHPLRWVPASRRGGVPRTLAVRQKSFA